MTHTLTLTINLTPDELETLTPVLQLMYMTRNAAPVAPDEAGPFGPPPAATAPWKGVGDVDPPGRVTVAIVPPAAPAPVVHVVDPNAPGIVETAPGVYVGPVAPAAVAPEAPELDADGYPWDDRIHSSSRAKLVKGGTWKVIRGASEAHVEQVRAELRAAGYGVAPAAAAPAPVAPVAPAAAAPAPVAPVAPAAAAPAPVAPVAPAAAAPAPVAPAAPAAAAPAPVAPVAPAAAAPAQLTRCETFPDFVKRVTVAKIPNETLLHALHAENVEGLALLSANVEKIPAIAARLGIGL